MAPIALFEDKLPAELRVKIYKNVLAYGRIKKFPSPSYYCYRQRADSR